MRRRTRLIAILSESKALFQSRLPYFIVFALIPAAVFSVLFVAVTLRLVGDTVTDSVATLGATELVAILVPAGGAVLAQLLVSPFVYQLALSARDGDNRPFAEIADDVRRKYVLFVGWSFLVLVFTIVGAGVFLIGAVVVSVVFVFVGFVVLDGHRRPLRRSVAAIRGRVWDVVGIMSVVLVVSAGVPILLSGLVGVIPAGLLQFINTGIVLIAATYAVCCLAIVYRSSPVGAPPRDGDAEPENAPIDITDAAIAEAAGEQFENELVSQPSRDRSEPVRSDD